MIASEIEHAVSGLHDGRGLPILSEAFWVFRFFQLFDSEMEEEVLRDA